ncbi:MAG: hypothetical protein NVSMB47_16930 [Polyangiales bacterium]
MAALHARRLRSPRRGLLPSLVRFAGALPLAVAVVACSSSGGGDVDHFKQTPTALGTPIADANDPAHPLAKLCGLGCPPADGTCPKSCPTLDARGVVVVAVDRFDETGDGKSIGNVYLQDPVQSAGRGTPFSGITVFQAQLIPNDLSLQPGDGVDATGPYQPFPGPASGAFAVPLPELVKPSVKLSYEGRSPDPIDVTLDDFADVPKGMAWVGRLVRLKNVTISGPFDAKRHEAAIDGSAATSGAKLTLASQLFLIDDPKGLNAAQGKTYASVTGVLNFFYSFKLCPRTSDDVTP